MTVIPVTIGKRNAFVNTQPSTTNTAPAFKAKENEKESGKDSYVKKPKESWVHKYRELIGFIAGGLVGDLIWAKTLRSKVEARKNMTTFKALALNVALDTVLGYIVGKIALQIGKDN